MSETDTVDAVTDRPAFAALGEALESAAGYLSAAGTTAGETVKTAAGKTGAVVSVGSYKAAYGLSFGIVFSAVFLKELLPVGSTVRRGFEDGAEAAFEAVEARKVQAEEEVAEAKVAKRKPSARKLVKVEASQED